MQIYFVTFLYWYFLQNHTLIPQCSNVFLSLSTFLFCFIGHINNISKWFKFRDRPITFHNYWWWSDRFWRYRRIVISITLFKSVLDRIGNRRTFLFLIGRLWRCGRFCDISWGREFSWRANFTGQRASFVGWRSRSTTAAQS